MIRVHVIFPPPHPLTALSLCSPLPPSVSSAPRTLAIRFCPQNNIAQHFAAAWFGAAVRRVEHGRHLDGHAFKCFGAPPNGLTLRSAGRGVGDHFSYSVIRMWKSRYIFCRATENGPAFHEPFCAAEMQTSTQRVHSAGSLARSKRRRAWRGVRTSFDSGVRICLGLQAMARRVWRRFNKFWSF